MIEQTFTLRLAEDAFSVEFTASPRTLKQELMKNFTRLRAKGGKSARLEVYDTRHGWCMACIGNQYQIISSPLILDYDRLIYSIYETLQQCRLWPTDADRKEQRIRAKRATFFVV